MADSKNLIDLKTLAKRLSIAPQTIRNRLSARTWPVEPVRLGRLLRWKESDVDALVEQGWSLPQPDKRPGNKS